MGRSRASSNASMNAPLSRSLSRRESVYAHAARWAAGGEEYDAWDVEGAGNGAGSFSRLTLVRAPSEGSALKR